MGTPRRGNYPKEISLSRPIPLWFMVYFRCPTSGIGYHFRPTRTGPLQMNENGNNAASLTLCRTTRGQVRILHPCSDDPFGNVASEIRSDTTPSSTSRSRSAAA
jgi:hypothetical protein